MNLQLFAEDTGRVLSISYLFATNFDVLLIDIRYNILLINYRDYISRLTAIIYFVHSVMYLDWQMNISIIKFA